MDYPMHYIYAGPAYSTLTEYVPAPYLRKSFHLKTLPEKAELLICGLGFYELYINGRRITKGLLAPYISNPDDLLYYDDYDLLGIGRLVSCRSFCRSLQIPAGIYRYGAVYGYL